MASARRAAGWLIAGLGALAMRAPFVAAGDAEVLELALRERLISTARTVEAAERADAVRDPSGELRTFVRGLGLELGLGAAPADGGDGVWRIQVRNGRGDVAIAHVRDDGKAAAVVRCTTLPAERFVRSRLLAGVVVATAVVDAAPEVGLLARLAAWTPGPGDDERGAGGARWLADGDDSTCSYLLDVRDALRRAIEARRLLRARAGHLPGTTCVDVGRWAYLFRATEDRTRFASIIPFRLFDPRDSGWRGITERARVAVEALRSGRPRGVAAVAVDVFSSDVRSPPDDVIAAWIAAARAIPVPPTDGWRLQRDDEHDGDGLSYTTTGGPGARIAFRRVGTSWRIAHVESIAGHETVPMGDVVGR